MSGARALFKITLNNNFGWSWMRVTYLRQHKRIWEPLVILLSMLAAGPALLYIYIKFLNLVYDQGAALGQGGIVLTLAILVAQLLIAFFGIYWVMSAFYFSRDLPQLVPLPLSPQTVLGSKFLQVMTNELLTALLLVVPAIAVYAVRAGAGPGYWLAAIPTILLLPIIPLALTAVIVIPLMRFINIRRSKDLLTILSMLLVVGLSLGFQLLAARIPEGGEGAYLKALLTSHNGLLKALGNRFPPSLWASQAIAGYDTLTGWLYFGLLLAVSLALLAAMLYLANRFFYRGLLAGGSVSAKKSRLTEADLGATKAGDAVSALASKEWRLLLRTPVWLMQWLMSAVIFPAIILITIFGRSVNFQFAEIMTRIHGTTLALGGAALVGFIASMLQLAPTTISREGRYFWLSKIIPVAPADQIRAKQRQIWAAYVLSLLPSFAVLGFFMKFQPAILAPAIILGLCSVYAMINLGLVLDLIWPKFNWNNPQQAMKGNINTLTAMVVSIIILAACGFLAGYALHAGWSTFMVYLAPAAALIVLGMLLGRLLRRLAEKRYREIEM